MGIYKGYKQTEEHKRRGAESRRRGGFFNCEICGKEFWRRPSLIKKGVTRFCSRECCYKYQKGRPKIFGFRPHLVGENNPKWKGGVSSENSKIRGSVEYKRWRKSVFERDGYCCTKCGVSGAKKELNADHIKSFADYPELRFDTNNGRTLCVDCHKETSNYGWKYYNSTLAD